jgi:hypothetical protein
MESDPALFTPNIPYNVIIAALVYSSVGAETAYGD